MQALIPITFGLLCGVPMGWLAGVLTINLFPRIWRWPSIVAIAGGTYLGGIPIAWRVSEWLAWSDPENMNADGPLLFIAITLVAEMMLLPAVFGAILGSWLAFQRARRRWPFAAKG